MSGKFGFFVIVLTLAFFITSVVYMIGKAFGQLLGNPESKAFKQALQDLRSRLNATVADLVPWDREMLSLLSLNRINEKKPGWFRTFSTGQFTTIYQEPVLAYATKHLGNISLTIVRTSDREIVLRRKGKETEIWLDNKPLGLFVDGVLLAPGKSSQTLARLENKPEELQHPLLLGDKTAATINDPKLSDSPNPRALTLLRELNPEEENVTLALAMEQLQRR